VRFPVSSFQLYRGQAYALPPMSAKRQSAAGTTGPAETSPASAHAPRIRDVPAPRRTQSFIGPAFGKVFKWPYRWALAGLYRAGFHAWQLTMLSLAANGVVGWLFLTGRRFVPGILLLVAGMLDVFDGGLARLRGEDSRSGAFLDSVLDRVSDLILFSCLFWSLAGQGRTPAAALALTSLIVSLMVSHIRAEAEAMDLSLTEGFMQRLERYVLLAIGLTTPGALLPVLAIMTGLGSLTLVQRLFSTWRLVESPETAIPEQPPRGPPSMSEDMAELE
jgi:CDP-diacylglycerol--glycerol-3-phosphate 3-phosphatidyltransferase